MPRLRHIETTADFRQQEENIRNFLAPLLDGVDVHAHASALKITYEDGICFGGELSHDRERIEGMVIKYPARAVAPDFAFNADAGDCGGIEGAQALKNHLSGVQTLDHSGIDRALDGLGAFIRNSGVTQIHPLRNQLARVFGPQNVRESLTYDGDYCIAIRGPLKQQIEDWKKYYPASKRGI